MLKLHLTQIGKMCTTVHPVSYFPSSLIFFSRQHLKTTANIFKYFEYFVTYWFLVICYVFKIYYFYVAKIVSILCLMIFSLAQPFLGAWEDKFNYWINSNHYKYQPDYVVENAVLDNSILTIFCLLTYI